MRAFLCSIDDAVWDAIEVGWTKSEAAKSTWDKVALAAANADSKFLNAIFYGVSPEEFHRISHITVAKEAWEILEILKTQQTHSDRNLQREGENSKRDREQVWGRVLQLTIKRAASLFLSVSLCGGGGKEKCLRKGRILYKIL